MVVDDDDLIRKLMGDVFAAQGYELRTCPDGKTALKTIPQERPDLVLLDMNLPDMTGLDICKALKSDPRTKHIPIIILTGEARELETRVQGLDLGADDYFFKPISPKVLVARVQSLLKLATKPTS